MPRVLISASGDCSPELGRTVLWRSGIERVLCPPLLDLEPVRAAKPDLILLEAHGEKIASLSDGRGVVVGKEGEIVLGRYKIWRIGEESIELSYVDGTGRTTIRLSGQ